MASVVFAGEAELVGSGQADAEEDRVIILAQRVERNIGAERDALFDLDAADRQDELGFPRREIVRRLVGGDAVFVEPRGLVSPLEDDRVMAGDRERVRAGQAGRAGADDRDALAAARRARERLLAGRHLRIDRMALKQADAHRLAFGGLAHAGLLAQRLGRADARAHAAHDVGPQDRFGRAERIVGGDLADEQGNVDRGRAGLLARRVETEIAAVGFDVRLVRR